MAQHSGAPIFEGVFITPIGGTATEHFNEVGHAMQSCGAGTDVLCRIVLHFN